MRIHILQREQHLGGLPDDLFPFFGHAPHPEAITPPLAHLLT
jgi:hypothetical protein